MTPRFILPDYVEQAMAIYDKLEDGGFVGKIPPCKGVIAFASTLRECENELRSTLEDWILAGLTLSRPKQLTRNRLIEKSRENEK